MSSVKIMKYVCSLLVIRRTHNTFISVCKLSSHPSWKQTPFFLLLVYLRFTVWATLPGIERKNYQRILLKAMMGNVENEE